MSVVLLLILIIVAILALRPARQILVHSLPLCNTRIEKVIKTLVKRDFPGSWNSFFTSMVVEVIAVNDVRCENEAYMANYAVTLEDGPKILFGIFHIHFSREGNLVSSAAITPWKQYPDKNDPQIDAAWQDFIQKVYPEEMNPTHN